MSYRRAYALADRLVMQARHNAAAARQPNLFNSYLLLYEIGQRNGWPMNRITAAIVGSGYMAADAAVRMGSRAVQAISHFTQT